MTKKTDLATLKSLTNLPTAANPVDMTKYGSPRTFVPSIRIISKGKFVDEEKISPGSYGSPGKDGDVTDLGKVVDIIPLAVRDKALDTNESPPVSSCDKNSEVFQDIVERAGKPNSGCMWGPSVLVFERKTGAFYEWFLGTASGRQEAPNLMPFLPVSEDAAKAFNTEAQPPQPCTLTTNLVKRGNYSWHVPVIAKCSTPFQNLPSLEEINRQVSTFVNPQVSAKEVAETTGRSV
jgi:hypothetical protein